MAKPKSGDSAARDNPTDQSAAPSAPSFEHSIEQVEQIIERIERGEQGLERSIADYERGATLLKACRQILARSEQRIQEIEADLSAAASTPPATPTPRSAPAQRSGSTPTPPPTDDGDDTPF